MEVRRIWCGYLWNGEKGLFTSLYKLFRVHCMRPENLSQKRFSFTTLQHDLFDDSAHSRCHICLIHIQMYDCIRHERGLTLS